MALKKIKIKNFKIFQDFKLELNPGLNIIVGDNEAGKSTILEAIHLALTGMINGKHLNTELTQYLFNNDSINEYIASLKTENRMQPPSINIELYFENCEEVSSYMGGINSDRDNAATGLLFSIDFDEQFFDEYQNLCKSESIETLPIEYYEFKWRTFADKQITSRHNVIKSVLIDSSLARYKNGSDIYISKIVKQSLSMDEAVKIAQAHRKMRESFRNDESVQAISKNIQHSAEISEREISLSVELLSKNAWENSLMTHIDDVPFHYIGKGEQCILKTRLALADKKAKRASIILMEEPENHLTYAKLNRLIDTIVTDCEDRQIIVSTHSSFVANKLGLESLILLTNENGPHTIRLTDLGDTKDFFKKLPGYDTLRLALSSKAILVEGPSDELVVQKAYMQINKRLPIEDEIDVISVGTSAKRFLKIAEKLKKCVAVIIDNDGKIDSLKDGYSDYLDNNSQDNILISYDKVDRTPQDNKLDEYNYNTLENLILLANGLETLKGILGAKVKCDDTLRAYMKNNKTSCALSIFDSRQHIEFPDYIKEAIAHVSK